MAIPTTLSTTIPRSGYGAPTTREPRIPDAAVTDRGEIIPAVDLIDDQAPRLPADEEDDGGSFGGMLQMAQYGGTDTAQTPSAAPPGAVEADGQLESDLDWLYRTTGGGQPPRPQPQRQWPTHVETMFRSAPRAEPTSEASLEERYRIAQVQRQQESDLDWLMRFTGGYPPPAPPPSAPALAQPAQAAERGIVAEAPRWGANLATQIPGGAIAGVGLMAAQPSVIAASGEQGRHAFRQWQVEMMNAIDRGEAVTVRDSGNSLADNQRRAVLASYRNATPEERTEYRQHIEAILGQGPPQPVQDRSFYQLGQTIQAFGRALIPLMEGYTEESVSTQLGRGVGSMLSGMVIPGGTAGRLAGFTSMGVGEATQNAVAYDKKERAAGREGLTQEEIVLSGLLGVGPGATDVLPIELMLSRMNIRGMTPQVSRSLAKAVAAVGGQVLMQIAVEGGQEGFQRFLQNAIAREVYNPQQNLFEGLVHEAALGGGVGGIVETARQIMTGALRIGRRGGTPGLPGGGDDPSAGAVGSIMGGCRKGAHR